MERREGYAYLLKYIIRFGDLIVLNALYMLLLYFMSEEGYMSSLGPQRKVIYFLFVNLTYFFVVSVIRPVTLEHFVYFDKVVQKASAQMIMCIICLTALLAVSKLFVIPAVCWILGSLVIGGVFVLWHILFRIIIKSYRKSGKNYRFVAIIGKDKASEELYESLRDNAYGYKVLGYFSEEPSEDGDRLPPYLGAPNDIESYIETNRIDELYYASVRQRDVYVKSMMSICDKHMIRFYLVPEYYKYVQRRMVLHVLNSTPVLSLRNEPLQEPTNRVVKRGLDIMVSLGVLLTIFPIIYIICGALIKLSSPGPIFFKQKRTGFQGKEFDCYKFRSMKMNKASDLKSATRNDPRVTKIGAFMRKTSLDEFPQFINVLKGDMSVVGPRPHMLKHTEEYSALISKFMVRHLVKPGITGWAQVCGCRGETKTVRDMEERVKKDVWYIENWSFYLDLKIIFLTVVNVFKGEENAF